jgi:hypothetical protein
MYIKTKAIKHQTLCVGIDKYDCFVRKAGVVMVYWPRPLIGCHYSIFMFFLTSVGLGQHSCPFIEKGHKRHSIRWRPHDITGRLC